jgi:4-amino-4-deoxy-L-arabinose transferase-like glycosyltransferase
MRRPVEVDESHSVPRWVWLGVAVAGAIGLLLRYWIYSTPLGQLDADEAVVGLMAKHVLKGEFPAFFWAQTYGGTLEAFLTAPLYALFGPHKLTIEIVPILLDVASAFVVWRIGLRLVGEPRARIAAALFWVWPSYVLWKSTKAHGFYGAGLLLVLLAILLVVRLADDVTVTDVALLGLVLGAGWWTTPQMIAVVLPLLLWFLAWKPSVFRKAHFFVVGGAVGAAPWLVFNMRNGWPSLRDGSVSVTSAIADRAVAIYRNGLPAILGMRAPWTQHWLLTPWLGRIVYALVIAGFLWLFLRGHLSPKLKLLCVIVLVYPLVLALSGKGGYEAEPRYLFLLTPVIALLIAAAVKHWSKEMFALVLCLLVFSSTAGLTIMADHNTTSLTVPNVILPPDISPLLVLLEQHDVDHAYANYWLAYLITFETDERIVATQDDGFLRYLPYAEEVAEDPEAAHVFVEGSQSGPPYVESLETAETPYERYQEGSFVLYIPHPAE